ncbi:hypothetical protein [Streptosporangium saharense]|uniref:hypothetical protein n=1 Tax=Streptosporangium saharense TaxID=1706840 RepID=UPI003EBE57F7
MFTELSGLLHRLARIAEGHAPEPSACIIDAQSVKTSTDLSIEGIDATKKIAIRKRSIVVDTLGLPLAVPVIAAHPTIRKTGADGGHRQHLVEHAALGIDMQTAMINLMIRRLIGEPTPTWRDT